MITRPMLAVPVDFQKLKFPVLVTPKLDGIRCLTIPWDQGESVCPADLFDKPQKCQAVGRKFLPIPNDFVRNWIEANLPPGLDGELMIEGSFQDVSSAFASKWGEPKFTYCIFDAVTDLKRPYHQRVEDLKGINSWWELDHWRTKNLVPVEAKGLEELTILEQEAIANGYEGLILRSPNSPYKLGRSTVNEGYMLKVKRFVDDEARVVGFEELTHNLNEKTSDAFGNAKRSTHQENQSAGGTLGALKCVTKHNVPFNIGTGFDHATRDLIWKNQIDYVGKLVKFKYQAVGTLTAPRCPVFLGFREPGDL